ncbi:hypothetical protein Moror_14578 [Moniliophthora roreri MCA 2997]|uniref:Uncharacterized protein n=2 Tax=Moniliophthora roreri TaxID=221103 RepID=V2XK80_MONRO|nr:hypothetical protein Moror_14578 [Moniliophthora roreri MCA 2997]
MSDSQLVPERPAIEPNQPSKSLRPGEVPRPPGQLHPSCPGPREPISLLKPTQHYNSSSPLQLLDQLDSELGPLLKRLKERDLHLYKAFMERLHNLYKVIGGAQRNKGDLKALLEEFLSWGERAETCDAERSAAVYAREEHRMLLQSKLEESFQDWNSQWIAAARYAFETVRLHSQMARLEAMKRQLDNEYFAGAETFL